VAASLGCTQPWPCRTTPPPAIPAVRQKRSFVSLPLLYELLSANCAPWEWLPRYWTPLLAATACCAGSGERELILTPPSLPPKQAELESRSVIRHRSRPTSFGVLGE